MKKSMLTERYIPSTYSLHYENKELNIAVYSDGIVNTMGFIGRAKKPVFNYRFPTPYKMNDWLKEWITNTEKNLTQKQKSKLEKSLFNKEYDLTNSKEIGIGSIVVSTWGYEQTNVDVFQITEIKGKRVTLKRISYSTVEGSEGHDCCKVLPVKDSFYESKRKENTIISTVKVNKVDNDKTHFTFSGFASYEYPHLWKGEEVYMSWYY